MIEWIIGNHEFHVGKLTEFGIKNNVYFETAARCRLIFFTKEQKKTFYFKAIVKRRLLFLNIPVTAQ